jgi:hypothetical protein
VRAAGPAPGETAEAAARLAAVGPQARVEPPSPAIRRSPTSCWLAWPRAWALQPVCLAGREAAGRAGGQEAERAKQPARRQERPSFRGGSSSGRVSGRRALTFEKLEVGRAARAPVAGAW